MTLEDRRKQIAVRLACEVMKEVFLKLHAWNYMSCYRTSPPVVSTPASHSEGNGFSSRHRDRLS
jgi:hypothetical protein